MLPHHRVRSYRTFPPLLRLRNACGAKRYISVALFLKSPSAGVTRYPCPVEPGLSSCAAFRRYARDCPTRSLDILYFISTGMSNPLQNDFSLDIIGLPDTPVEMGNVI